MRNRLAASYQGSSNKRTVTVPPAPEVAPPARPTADRKERANSSANRHIERPDSSMNRHSGRLSAHGGQRQTVSAMKIT